MRRADRRRQSKHAVRRWFPTLVGLGGAIVVLASRGGDGSVTVQAADGSRQPVATAVHFKRWAYVDPLRAVKSLRRGRVDMGVDYDGAGPILALGRGKVTMASDHDSGPERCWGRTCWPVSGIVVYRLVDGPFAGKYVYDAENITVNVIAGQIVKPGEQIATLRPASPYLETGWASGNGPETLAIAKHQQPLGRSRRLVDDRGPQLQPCAHPAGRAVRDPAAETATPAHAGWLAEMATKSGTARAPQSSGPISDGSTGPR